MYFCISGRIMIDVAYVSKDVPTDESDCFDHEENLTRVLSCGLHSQISPTSLLSNSVKVSGSSKTCIVAVSK